MHTPHRQSPIYVVWLASFDWLSNHCYICYEKSDSNITQYVPPNENTKYTDTFDIKITIEKPRPV